MIKFVATTHNGNTVIGLGLVEENLKRLKEDKPIIVWLQELGINEKIEICIFYGRTEEEIYNTFQKDGLLKGTKIIREYKKI